MEAIENMLKRRSVRKFKKEEINDEDINTILHMATSGPSAMNKKPWEFYVIKNEEKLNELRHSGLYKGYESPLAIVVAGNKLKALPLKLSEYWVQDCSAAAENILLAATGLGLGSVWCGVYPVKTSVKKIRKILNLPAHIIPLNIIYIGYPEEESEPRDQYNEKCVHFI